MLILKDFCFVSLKNVKNVMYHFILYITLKGIVVEKLPINAQY